MTRTRPRGRIAAWLSRLEARYVRWQLYDTERYTRQLERALRQHRHKAEALRVRAALLED